MKTRYHHDGGNEHVHNDETDEVLICNGIGDQAKCGEYALMKVSSMKWNSFVQQIEEIEVWLCRKHYQELQGARTKICST